LQESQCAFQRSEACEVGAPQHREVDESRQRKLIEGRLVDPVGREVVAEPLLDATPPLPWSIPAGIRSETRPERRSRSKLPSRHDMETGEKKYLVLRVEQHDGGRERQLQSLKFSSKFRRSLSRACIVFVADDEEALRIALRANEIRPFKNISCPSNRGRPVAVKAEIGREAVHQVIDGADLAVAPDENVGSEQRLLPSRPWEISLKTLCAQHLAQSHQAIAYQPPLRCSHGCH
jgi:hypothetical protein